MEVFSFAANSMNSQETSKFAPNLNQNGDESSSAYESIQFFEKEQYIQEESPLKLNSTGSSLARFDICSLDTFQSSRGQNSNRTSSALL